MANTSTATINIRIDEKTKRKAMKTAKDIGLDISSAIKMFLTKFIDTGTIPFRIGEMNDPRIIKKIKAEVEWTKKYGKRYTSEELFAEWDKLNA